MPQSDIASAHSSMFLIFLLVYIIYTINCYQYYQIKQLNKIEGINYRCHALSFLWAGTLINLIAARIGIMHVFCVVFVSFCRYIVVYSCSLHYIYIGTYDSMTVQRTWRRESTPRAACGRIQQSCRGVTIYLPPALSVNVIRMLFLYDYRGARYVITEYVTNNIIYTYIQQ